MFLLLAVRGTPRRLLRRDSKYPDDSKAPGRNTLSPLHSSREIESFCPSSHQMRLTRPSVFDVRIISCCLQKMMMNRIATLTDLKDNHYGGVIDSESVVGHHLMINIIRARSASVTGVYYRQVYVCCSKEVATHFPE